MAHRDKALLLTGFAGAFRRSKLVNLCVKDIEFRDEGMLITIAKSKTDQMGVGRQVPIHSSLSDFLCPVKNLKQWLQKTGIQEGLLFRNVNKGDKIGSSLTGRSVNRIVKNVFKMPERILLYIPVTVYGLDMLLKQHVVEHIVIKL